MRIYTVIVIQFMIWSGFTLAQWLSEKDWYVYEIIMFMVFFYLAVKIGNLFIHSTRRTLYTTLISLGLYEIFHISLFNELLNKLPIL